MPRVSIIVPTYNSSRTLQLALRSIINQTFADFEVQVVGDGCTDDSERVVKSLADPRLQWTNLDRNYGSQCWPNNEGLRRAAGEYVAYLGHDDLWFPWHLASVVEVAESTKALFVYATVVQILRNGGCILRGVIANGYGSDFCPPSGWLHRHDIVQQIGFWRDPHDLINGTDFDFCGRAFRAGLRFGATRKVSVIKWNSGDWGLIALQEGPPQEDCLHRMNTDPEALEASLLKAAAFQYAALTPTWKQSARATFRPVLDLIGRERWPMSLYYLWKNRRLRRRRRPGRGMPHADGTMTLPPRKEQI